MMSVIHYRLSRANRQMQAKQAKAPATGYLMGKEKKPTDRITTMIGTRLAGTSR